MALDLSLLLFLAHVPRPKSLKSKERKAIVTAVGSCHVGFLLHLCFKCGIESFKALH